MLTLKWLRCLPTQQTCLISLGCHFHLISHPWIDFAVEWLRITDRDQLLLIKYSSLEGKYRIDDSRRNKTLVFSKYLFLSSFFSNNDSKCARQQAFGDSLMMYNWSKEMLLQLTVNKTYVIGSKFELPLLPAFCLG